MELLERVSDFTTPEVQPIAFYDLRQPWYTDQPLYFVTLCGIGIYTARSRERAEAMARSSAERHGWNLQNVAIECY